MAYPSTKQSLHGQVVELDCWSSYAGLACEAALLTWAAGWAAELGCLAELLGRAAAGLDVLKILECPERP